MRITRGRFLYNRDKCKINQLAGKAYFKWFLQNNLQKEEVRLQNAAPILYNN